MNKRKQYIIDGKVYTNNEIPLYFDISLATFYRRLADGKSPEEAVHYVRQRKPRQIYVKPTKKEYVDYPQNLILELIGENNQYEYDLNTIKANFVNNFEAMVNDNSRFFDARILYILKKHFEEGMKYSEIATDLMVSRQRVFQMIESTLNEMRKPLLSDYYLMGKEFVQKRKNYYEKREQELLEEMKQGTLSDVIIKKIDISDEDKQKLGGGLKFKIELSIKSLPLSNRAIKGLMKNGITTINELLQTSLYRLKQFKGLGKETVEEIRQVVTDFINKGEDEDE